MSDHETTVNIFVHLLNTQPSLFSEEDRITLMELIQNQADDIQFLSNAISDWLSEHDEVDEVLAKFEEIGTKAPGDKQANTNIPKYELDKKNILNEIQQSSSSPKDVEKPTRNN
ncbi:hypothetical protein A4S05_36945 [Nostoc sp. KVJ20]|uniref:hypothetical protein n=1 Tax=Nostoc sp. KVJ20 TaxID=457944 RepID=UPI00083DD8D1|nr:hypothetical protein [Nostoc sp. KVJ20]ODG99711.1 hypothetical protein A4S05_36945 [Nostoc sp. KVJ20]